ncbi:MAG TPA: glycosyltransferase family 39 protein [Terracidiphilus sp.]|nr:glycosyltransferase family 39 protein [Terracidiphilus sp.]
MHESTDSRPAHADGTSALWLTGLAFTAIHIAFSWRYGFHRDELLSYSNAMHLDWCYVVYPPLTAWFARAELAVFGTSLMGYRFLPAIAVGLVSVLAGLIARAMGAGRRAMVVAAVAAGIEGPVAFAGCFFSYMSFDLLWWVLVAWAVAELVRSQNPRWWVVIGAGFGLGLLTKYTILAYAAGLLVGMLFTSNRRYFRSGWFWCGVALTLAMTAPVIVWQFQHHFVALAWMKSIHKRDMGWGRTDHFILNQFWNVTSPVTVPLWCAGLWYLFRYKSGKPFRIIGWMYLVTIVLFTIAKARDYYLAPAYPMLLAAGAAWGENWIGAKSSGVQKRIMRAVRISLAVATLLVFALTLPIAQIQSSWWRFADAANGGNFSMQLGWPELAATVAHVRDSLPADERDGARVMAGDEGEAGAVNLYGRAYNLHDAISGMNSNWLRGYGDPPPTTVIAVGFKRSELDRIFARCDDAARLTMPYGVDNQAIGERYEVYVCRDIREPWPVFWKNFQYYG